MFVAFVGHLNFSKIFYKNLDKPSEKVVFVKIHKRTHMMNPTGEVFFQKLYCKIPMQFLGKI